LPCLVTQAGQYCTCVHFGFIALSLSGGSAMRVVSGFTYEK
jgi:hypothetical protein